MRDFAGVLSQTKTPGIVEGGVGEWSEGSNRDLGVGEVRVDGLKLVLEISSACERSCQRPSNSHWQQASRILILYL